MRKRQSAQTWARPKLLRRSLASVLLWGGLLSSSLGQVAPLWVTNLNDSGPGSLRQAIATATAGDVIAFSLQGAIMLTSGELMITNDLFLAGPGAAALEVDGSNNGRVFEIASNASVVLAGVTIVGGHAPDGRNGSETNPPTGGSNGGGISNAGWLRLMECVVENNQAGAHGGYGGGVYNSGTFSATDCMFSNNLAGTGGGSASGSPGGHGGAIYNLGVMVLTNCVFTANLSGEGATASNPCRAGFGGVGGNGGGIYNSGSLSLCGCTLNSNQAGTGAAGTGDCEGYGGPGIDGGNGGGIFNSGTISLIACTLAANLAGAGGTGGFGGNESGLGGGGGEGGAIFNSGTLSMTNCTLNANEAGAGGNCGPVRGLGGKGGDGGGILNTGFLSLVACTLVANSAGPGGDGAGGDNWRGGNGGNGGGICNATNASKVNVLNTLVAENNEGTAGTPGANVQNFFQGAVNGSGPDIYGAITSLGHNLVGQTNGMSGFTSLDLISNPLLGSLQNNGGPTATMAPLHGSPALETGDDALLAPPYNLITDQRGFPRRAGAHVDIGAFEYRFGVACPVQLNTATTSSRQFQIAFTNNTPGATFSILGTTNVSPQLSDWTVLGPATQTAPGQFQFMDPQTAGNTQRFYRVSSP